MLSITNHQENTNQNHNEISSHTCQNAYYQEDNKYLVAFGSPAGSVVKNLPASAGDIRVGSLIGEDPSCYGAPEPMCHSFWVCALQPRSWNYWALQPWNCVCCNPDTCVPQSLWSATKKPLQWEAYALQLERGLCSSQLEKSLHNIKDPAQPKINE